MTQISDAIGPRYLWLTRFFPYPTHAGDRIYSARLIEALADQDCQITVFVNEGGGDAALLPALLPNGSARRVEWITCPPGSGSRMARYPFSRLPRHALRFSAPGPRQILRSVLARQNWDAVLIDYVTMGWTLPLLKATLRRTGDRPRLVYVAHNHEASVRQMAARHSRAALPLRLAQRIDGGRIAALERRLLAEVDCVTVNTAADLALFETDAPQQRYQILVPGYDGPQLAERTLTAETPRRVVVVGSFDWIVKQQNLIEFLEAASPLADHGIGIDIVGSGPTDLLDKWRHRFPYATIHGRVAAVEPYLQGARISVVPERTGGGFKHKVLNAVFQRSPVFGIAGSITQVPLVEGQSVRLFADFPALVQGIIRDIDALDGLNALQSAAYAACQDQFDWRDRGKSLRGLLTGKPGE
ncbi:glycosyltransferase [Elstera sp.]|jgi:glycosyltransferase involved in cell wall biosynthesis|uniref:glycosyltransferase n=1 Tax=Elstera sp. TaxID=1916664 RepID=UPI0037BEAFA4